MTSILLYILKSSICISVLYLLFRILLRKDSSFAVNRAALLSIVAASIIIPLLQLPQQMQSVVPVNLMPEFRQRISTAPEAKALTLQAPEITAPETKNLSVSIESLSGIIYLAGMLIALGFLIRSLIMILILFRNANVIQKENHRVLIVDSEIPSFAFRRSVVISQNDFDLHGNSIIAHEQAHIHLNHFYDLVLLELIRIIHWFNPAVYWLIRDLKEIHEFQADEHTLQSGIDATNYQLLIIQKSVGPKRFALANSFNHYQIKNRIVMMNKSKTGKAWRWKVATFLPVIALLLLTFCKTGQNASSLKEGKGITTGENVNSLKQENKMIGTWQLVSYQYGTAEEAKWPDNMRAVKLITPTHFTWIHYGTNDNKVVSSAGGTYVFDGENYTENVEFGSSGMVPYFGKSQFKIKIEGDQMFLSGSLSNGLKIQEVWKKL